QCKNHKNSHSASYLEGLHRRSGTLRHTYEMKQIYARSKETIERVFADAKEKHGMRWTTRWLLSTI
ncbi:transposase, partial [Robertmurraya korlensis]|uniref:transposase n=1 Tax=Robertmurraya korlensis TaxID=519977 RepID=UPI003F777779